MSNLPSPSKKSRRSLILALLITALTACMLWTSDNKSQARVGEARASGGGEAAVASSGRHSLGVQSGVEGAGGVAGLWKDAAESAVPAQVNPERGPNTYRVLRLDQSLMRQALAQAPLESSAEAAHKGVVITLPVADGRLWRFQVQESPIMSAELAAQFPEVKTYSGQGIDDPTATMRLSMTPRGLSAFVISEGDSFMVAPYSETDSSYYKSYFTRDVEGASFECLVPGLGKLETSPIKESATPPPYANSSITIASGARREYRMSFSVSQQFYQRFGGPVISAANDVGVVAAITAYVNNVNVIYERDIAIRFKFHSWIADRPGFCSQFNCFAPNQDTGQMMQANQFLLDNVHPGAANYDVGSALGYSFDPLPGGVSSFGSGGLGAACEALFKGQSATRLVGTAGDYMGTVILAHEWGHMFGARHTFSSSRCPANQLDQVENRLEPGSGSTIMSYAPICPPENLFTGNPSSGPDNYFHVGSLLKIATHKSSYSSCGQSIATGNAPPIITNGGAVATIPALTPFTLTAAASDPNGDALTYAWEEWDPGATHFRSYRPTTNPSRTFPSLPYILDFGNFPPLFLDGFLTGEVLSGLTRPLFFTVTVRDNRSGGGGTSARDELLQVNVIGGAGPFKVTQPNAPVALAGGGQTTISWNVANTNLAPIGTSNVRILLSSDGGNTFPVVLAASTPNDGAATVTLPSIQTSTARIKIEAVGNIYFDISDTNFGIISSNSLPNLTPFQPAGWSDKIVVSNAAGTSADSSPLRATDTLYVDWAVINNGNAAAGVLFHTKLFVDGVERATWFTNPPLGVNFFGFIQDHSIGTLGPGTHTIKIVTDTDGVIPESNEADNEHTKTIVVSSQSSVQFSAAGLSVGEAAGRATVTVTRSGDPSGAATVDYRTADTDTFTVGCADLSNNRGGAFGRCDFATSVGTLQFSPGETQKSLVVPIIDDGHDESAETFQIVLSNAAGAALGAPTTITVTIQDNDAAGAQNPVIASTQFFVRQQYLDFLSREPDQAGFNAWVGHLNGCGNIFTGPNVASTCDRIYVSGEGFFRSPEFSLKGFYVFRFYKVAFNRLPEYPEIVSDMSFVAGTTPAEVFARKAQLATLITQRAEFQTAYGGMTNAQYVSALMSRYNLTQVTTPDPAQPDTGGNVTLTAADLTNRLNANQLTRAQVLRAVADSDGVGSREFNNAFVAMQYYGYLRRKPEQSGFSSWLAVLQSGDVRTMVNGFLNSPEYKLRFGAP